MSDIVFFADITPDDLPRVGGKGLSLGLLASAGLPVPEGFCLTAGVYRRLRATVGDDELTRLARAPLERLGGGRLAVRSSALAEDGAAASFAGQAETVLGVAGVEAVVAAVRRCWASLDSERAAAYRAKQGVADDDRAMAVVVQRLVEAESAGVLFTADPMDATGRRMLVESSWGLGEAVVSGKVTPDRFSIDRASGEVVSRAVARKSIRIDATGETTLPETDRERPSLTDAQLRELAALGRAVEAYHGSPRDIEWAYADGQFRLLQSRPITTVTAAERERVRVEEVTRLRAFPEADSTVWSRFNLSEILPTPTPMTWAIVSRHLMSGRGGFGLMYRDLGYDPDPSLDDVGVFDLVCGRPYCNLRREPLLHARFMPLRHSVKALKADPAKAIYPVPALDPWGLLTPRALMGGVLSPWLALRGWWASRVRRRELKTFAGRFRGDIVPRFRAWVAEASRVEWTTLDDKSLLGVLDDRIRRTLVDFARDSLKPTALAALAMDAVRGQLSQVLGDDRAAEFTAELASGAHPDADSDLAAGIHVYVTGEMNREAFLSKFGHRGRDEMELSQPRWREPGATLPKVAGTVTAKAARPTPIDVLSREARLSPEQRQFLVPFVETMHLYLGLRETGKHVMLEGYALVREALLELDRRGRLAGGVFHLTPEELPDLLAGKDLSATVAERKRRRSILLGLEAPVVLFGDDLGAIGRPVTLDGDRTLAGTPVSAGVAEGPALVLTEPTADVPEPGYILVCPSTDPAWVPLFVGAAGLVMETGGVLSHGAIVAREFGVPAVAGIPDVMRRLKTGQRVKVDGGSGRVEVA